MAARIRTLLRILLIAGLSGVFAVHADDGSEGWLRYAPLSLTGAPAIDRELPANLVRLDNSPVSASAENEILRGVRSMLSRTLRVADKVPDHDDAWVLGSTGEIKSAFPEYHVPSLEAEGFAVSILTAHGHHYWIVAGADPRGILYGAFHVLSGIARGLTFAALSGAESPAVPVRWVNQWDNPNGTIERGYAGRSIFFDNGAVRSDVNRAGEYARLLASVGVNGCTINNVNADPHMLTPGMIRGVARIADAFRPWGVRLSMSVAINSPQALGDLNTYDPGDPKVAAWWRAKFDEIYAALPDFAGVVVKADSEGQPGPSQYGRTPVDAANMLAAALKPHGGIVLSSTTTTSTGMTRRRTALALPTIFSIHSTGSSPTTSSSRSRTAPSTSRFASRSHHSLPDCRKPTPPSSCKLRRNTWASSATSFFCPCNGRRILTSICMRIIA
jgi:alpha-glucuronidase